MTFLLPLVTKAHNAKKVYTFCDNFKFNSCLLFDPISLMLFEKPFHFHFASLPKLTPHFSLIYLSQSHLL